MLDPERETVRTLGHHPGLFVGGAAVTVAWLFAQVVVAVPVMLVTLPRNTQPAFALALANLVSVLILPPALAGLYTTASEARTGDERFGINGSLPTYVLGCVRHARALMVATATFRAVAFVPSAVAFALMLATDTALNYWQYVGAGPVHVNAASELVVVVMYALVAGAIGRLVLAFYDLAVLLAGVPARRGWRAALRFTRRHPRAVLRYGAGRFLLWAPMLAVFLLEIEALTGGGAFGGILSSLVLYFPAALVIGTVTSTMLAAHHVVVYERTVEPVLREPTATGADAAAATDSPLVAAPGDDGTTGRSNRGPVVAVAIAALLVSTAAVGAGAVRLGDTRPMPDTDSGPVDDAMAGDEVVRNAGGLLANASYRTRMRSYRVNHTTGERRLVFATRNAVDRPDRRLRMSGRVLEEPGGDWQRTEYYASDATFAMNVSGDRQSSGDVRLEERFVGQAAGDWVIGYVPGYSSLSSTPTYGFADADANGWQVLDRADGQVVVGYTHRPDGDPPDDGSHLAVEVVRLTVDRDTGRAKKLVNNRTFVESENGTAVDRYSSHKVMTYGDYDSTRVDRPEAIGPRGPIEWLWDIVYY